MTEDQLREYLLPKVSVILNVHFSDAKYSYSTMVAERIVDMIIKLGKVDKFLNFTENENGGKKDSQMAASR